MAEDIENGNNSAGRPRRSSFVPPADENTDFVPILPAVGSTPIPAASDVNYFPTVATGQPSLREPEPPARLVVPNRTSMTEEEIATAFAESTEMSSAEQIALLDAQMTLREQDLRTARDFVATLKSANPREAAPLLEELKAKFADVDAEVAEYSLGLPTISQESTPTGASSESVSDASSKTDATPAVAQPTISPRRTELSNASGAPEPGTGRNGAWNFVINLAVVIALLVPASASVFTVFGSPVPDAVESLIGISGVAVLVGAIVASLPLILVARTTTVRNALTLRSALVRISGRVGGTSLAIVFAIFVLVGFVEILVATSQGVGIQLASIPGVTSTLSAFTPQAHLTVLVVAVLVTVGFAIAAVPRALFRAKILVLSGFVAVGPAIVLVTDIAVVANSGTGAIVTPENLLLATGIVPLVLVILTATETGIATVVRRDEKTIYGLWLYIGLALGVVFAAWVLISGMSADNQGSVFVGSNPALHLIASNNEIAFVLGAITYALPIVLVAALVGRTLMMLLVSGDRETPPLVARIGVSLIPVVFVVVDALGLIGDVSTSLPGLTFLAVPVMAIVGLMAGASIASRRALSGGAKIVNAILTLVFAAIGLVLSLWSVPALASLYDATLSGIATAAGLSGATLLAIPALVLALSFVSSLVVSAFGARRPVSAE